MMDGESNIMNYTIMDRVNIEELKKAILISSKEELIALIIKISEINNGIVDIHNKLIDDYNNLMLGRK
jgi:hypothetical protein